MGKNIRPKIKSMRRFGMLPEELSVRQPSKRFRKKSEYGLRLEEKQKLKFIFGLMERQLKRYVGEAKKSQQDPSETLLRMLETRLDNVVYLLGFSKTLSQARQLVNHRHIRINDKKVDIPSYNVQSGQNISLYDKAKNNPLVIENIKEKKPETIPAWLKRENDVGQMIRWPEKDELRKDINMSYVMEFYS